MKNKKLTVVKNNTHKVRVAKAMLRSCLQELKQRYGFFIYAINLFEPVAVKETMDLATDGKHLFFNASRLLEFYKAYGTKEVKRHIMHMLLHGIFGDFELREEERWQKLRWSVMDFKVDEMLGLLGMEENERFEGEIIKYHPGLYLEGRKSRRREDEIVTNGSYVWVDDHQYWARQGWQQGLNGKKTDSNSNTGQENEISAEELEEVKKISDMWRQVRMQLFPAKYTSERASRNIFAVDIVRGMLSSGYGMKPGAKKWMEQAALGKAKDYQNIIKNLIDQSEVCKEEDTIDPMLYLYGLECYGDVALVEPLEVSEQKILNTLVLAVDTSGSCIDMASVFLRETVGILRDAQALVKKGSVYYAECDVEISQENIFEDFQKAAEFMEAREVSGGGGTCFIPVFESVEHLKKQGRKIDGLFYLSDGCGEFPEEAPDYPVWFVMDQRLYEEYSPELPDWVTVVWL